jgi:soluble lytic murein transglycosylase-like protein
LNDPAGRQTIVGDFDRLGVGLATKQERTVFVILVGKSPPPMPTASPAPAPPTQSIPEIIAAAARRHGVDPDFMIRLARCESGLNPRAVNPAGPYIGLFQFAPSTFTAFGGHDIYNPADQSEITARMLARGLAHHWPVCSRVAAR